MSVCSHLLTGTAPPGTLQFLAFKITEVTRNGQFSPPIHCRHGENHDLSDGIWGYSLVYLNNS